jgi:hypothetical protein
MRINANVISLTVPAVSMTAHTIVTAHGMILPLMLAGRRHTIIMMMKVE